MAVDLNQYKKPQNSNPQPTGVNLSAYKTPTPEDNRGFLGTKKSDNVYGKVIDNSITRGIQSFFPGKKVGESIGTLAGFAVTGAKEKLGMAPEGAARAYDLSAPTPLQTIGDVAKGAATVAGFKLPTPVAATGLKTIGKTALQGGALGALSGAGAAAVETEQKPTVQSLIDVAKGAAVGGATGAVVSGGVSAVGQLVKSWGTGIQNSVIKPQKADIEDGFDIETVRKYDLGGSLHTTAQKTEDLMDDISKQLHAKLEASDKTIDMKDVYSRTAERITANKEANFSANRKIAGALQELSEEIDELGDPTLMPITHAQTVKRAAGQYGAWTYGVADAEATARQKVYNTFYNELKKSIEQNSPDGVAELNRQLSELIPVKNAVIRRIPVEARNNVLSLTDIIALSASAVDVSALGAFAASRAVKSGSFGNLLAKGAQRVQGSALPLGTMLGGGVADLASQPTQQLSER